MFSFSSLFSSHLLLFSLLFSSLLFSSLFLLLSLLVSSLLSSPILSFLPFSSLLFYPIISSPLTFSQQQQQSAMRIMRIITIMRMIIRATIQGLMPRETSQRGKRRKSRGSVPPFFFAALVSVVPAAKEVSNMSSVSLFVCFCLSSYVAEAPLWVRVAVW